jgi:ATP-dependent Clp protease ATP-binding subunit ClpX
LATNRITADDEKDQQEFNEKRDKLLQQVQSEDVIKFGMIPELVSFAVTTFNFIIPIFSFIQVGRFPVRVPFHSLDKESLKRVMTDPKDSLLAQAKLYFKKHSVSS